jgi:hypothetical protein
MLKEFLIESEVQFEKDLALFEGTDMPSREELKDKARVILEQFEEIESLEEAAQPNPKLGAIATKIAGIYAKEYGELKGLAEKAKAVGKMDAAKKFEARAEKAKKALDALKAGGTKVGTAIKVVVMSLNLVKFSLGTVLLIAGTVFGLSAASLGIGKMLAGLKGLLTVSAWTPAALKGLAGATAGAAKTVGSVAGATVSGVAQAAKGAVTGTMTSSQAGAAASAITKSGAAATKTAFVGNAGVFLTASAQLIAIALVFFAAIVVLKKIAIALYSKKLSADAAKLQAKNEVVKAVNKAAAAAKAKAKKKAA